MAMSAGDDPRARIGRVESRARKLRDMPHDHFKSLPPIARSKAMDTRLPRNRRPLWIGLGVTALLHAALLAYLLLSPSSRVSVPMVLVYFTPKLTLPEKPGIPDGESASTEAQGRIEKPEDAETAPASAAEPAE